MVKRSRGPGTKSGGPGELWSALHPARSPRTPDSVDERRARLVTAPGRRRASARLRAPRDPLEGLGSVGVRCARDAVAVAPPDHGRGGNVLGCLRAHLDRRGPLQRSPRAPATHAHALRAGERRRRDHRLADRAGCAPRRLARVEHPGSMGARDRTRDPARLDRAHPLGPYRARHHVELGSRGQTGAPAAHQRPVRDHAPSHLQRDAGDASRHGAPRGRRALDSDLPRRPGAHPDQGSHRRTADDRDLPR